MNNNSYKLKYYKYKNKYLELKQKNLINQEGGIFPAQTGKIAFFIDLPPKFGYDRYLNINVEEKQIYGGMGGNHPIELSYGQLCELSCAVVKEGQSAKEWIFPIVERSAHYTTETLKYRRNSVTNFSILKIDKDDNVEKIKNEVLSCLSDLNKIIKSVLESDKTTKWKKDTLGYIDRTIRYCIVYDVSFAFNNKILAIYKYPEEKKIESPLKTTSATNA
jgi:hypothetical protein